MASTPKGCWTSGRAARLIDGGMEPRAALREARRDWEQLPALERRLLEMWLPVRLASETAGPRGAH